MPGRNVGFVNKWPESRQVEEEWILNNGFAQTGNQVSTVHRVSGGSAVRLSGGSAVRQFGSGQFGDCRDNSAGLGLCLIKFMRPDAKSPAGVSHFGIT